MGERRNFRRALKKLRSLFNCTYVPLDEDDVCEENCVVFKGLGINDPMGEVMHIAHVLFKVLRVTFQVKRVVLVEENDDQVIMIVEFTDILMAKHMLQKAEKVMPSISTERYFVPVIKAV